MFHRDMTLRPEIESIVLEHVRSGEYSSANELVNQKSLELAQNAPANLEWLHANGAAYMGEWVALHKGRLIAHGKPGRFPGCAGAGDRSAVDATHR
jgi:hypothetical protein